MRTELLAKNAYSNGKGYSSGHPNALSDGDEKGKGENDKKIGSLTDINTRTESVSRNYYGENRRYPDITQI